MAAVPLLSLGQSGFRFKFGPTTVYVDPYLSDHVEEMDGPDMKRLISAPIEPDSVRDADWVLSTHIHIDHADPKTLIPISMASPTCRFLCPAEVGEKLANYGLTSDRIELAVEQWVGLGPDLRVMTIPAAHTSIERDGNGHLRFVGYIFEFGGRRIYHAGDTAPAEELTLRLQELGPIDVAFLPVNERSYYRDRRGIVGNMSIREACEMGDEIGARTLIPMHWDMFAPNSVDPREIQIVYETMKPRFELNLKPQAI